LAKAQGLKGFTAEVLVSNGRMLSLFKHSGLRIVDELQAGIHRLIMLFT